MDGGGNGVTPLNLGRPACFHPAQTLIVESPSHPSETGAYWLPLEKPVGGAVLGGGEGSWKCCLTLLDSFTSFGD